jgi:hypothetical protein
MARKAEALAKELVLENGVLRDGSGAEIGRVTGQATETASSGALKSYRFVISTEPAEPVASAEEVQNV